MATTTFSTTALASAAGAAAGATPTLLTTSTTSLPDACANTRHALTDDGAGGQVSSDQTLGPWACRMLKEPTPVDRTLAGGERVTVAARQLEVQLGADIAVGDDLAHGGRRYVVLDSDQGTTGATFLTVFLEWLGELAS